MQLDLLPHELRPDDFWDPSWCSGFYFDIDDELWLVEGLCGLCYALGSRHSMFATYGPQDIMSLVTPRHCG